MKKTMGLVGRRGFTLIELLVVISIIGLLSSVVLASLNGARVKADDTQRNQIVGEYVKALALAYDEARTGQYPAPSPIDTNYRCLGDFGVPHTCYLGLYSENAIVNAAVATYLPSLPVLKPVILSGLTITLPLYRCPNPGNCSQAEIQWFLQQPNQKCIKGATPTSTSGTTRCNLTLN